MRRLAAITAFALFLAVPVWAQHGGGGHGGGGGGHAGFGGGHVGSSGGHVSGGSFSGSTRSNPGLARAFTRPSFSSQRNFSHSGPYLHDGFRGSRFGNYGYNRGYRYGCYGYSCRGGYGYYAYPWYPWYAGYYDPWWWWDSGSGYDDSYEQELANANEMNQQNLEQEQMLRQEEAEGDQDLYDKDAYARSAPAAQPEGQPVLPATVLIFRDQHKEEIQNYAIVGQTLWNFAPQRTEKIPLATLDLAATTKANDDRGLSFRLPTTGVPR